MHRVTLETYYKGKERKRQSTKFSVPFEWLEEITVGEYNQSVSEFIDSYTWDDAERIQRKAIDDKVMKYESQGGK